MIKYCLNCLVKESELKVELGSQQSPRLHYDFCSDDCMFAYLDDIEVDPKDKRIEELQTKLNRAIEILEYYADKSNWGEVPYNPNPNIDYGQCLWIGNFIFGGLAARVVVAELRKEKE
jgi:hypothetical protein